MSGLDGLYKHAGITTTWSDRGIVIHRGKQTRTLVWSRVQSVRRRQSPHGVAHIQLIVGDHVPPANLGEDFFSIPVRSDADANRLLVTFSWQASGTGITVDDLA